jgi:hypothetical protein
MKLVTLVFAPLAALAVFALGCNTAQVTTPPLVDAGPPCPQLAPVVSCDAGAWPTPGACTGGVTLVLDLPDASNTLAAGSYALGCTVGFFVADPASADCLRAPACTCVSADAGPVDPDAGDVDAGALGETPPGVWQCVAPGQ